MTVVDYITEQFLVIAFIRNMPWTYMKNAATAEEAIVKVKHDNMTGLDNEDVVWIRAIKIEDIPEYGTG